MWTGGLFGGGRYFPTRAGLLNDRHVPQSIRRSVLHQTQVALDLQPSVVEHAEAPLLLHVRNTIVPTCPFTHAHGHVHTAHVIDFQWQQRPQCYTFALVSVEYVRHALFIKRIRFVWGLMKSRLRSRLTCGLPPLRARALSLQTGRTPISKIHILSNKENIACTNDVMERIYIRNQKNNTGSGTLSA